jgi:hypothetical protein
MSMNPFDEKAPVAKTLWAVATEEKPGFVILGKQAIGDDHLPKGPASIEDEYTFACSARSNSSLKPK